MHKSLKRFSILIMSLFIVIGVMACSQSSKPTSGNDNPIADGSASWERGYYSLNEISTTPEIDVIVTGTITRIAEVVNLSKIPDHPTYCTRFVVKVEDILKGKPDNEIIVNQLGNPDKPGWGIIDDPLFEVGHKYLLFLGKTTTTNPTYAGTGPWGRYEIIKDQVYSLNYTKTDSGYAPSEGLNFNGTQIEDIKKNISEVFDTTQLVFQDIIRLDAGTACDIEIAFISGKYGPGIVSYTVQNDNAGITGTALPEGLEVTAGNTQFTAQPGGNYVTTLQIKTSKNLVLGTYFIKLQYKYGEFTSGERRLTIYVDPPYPGS
jgi:hypothetical protein